MYLVVFAVSSTAVHDIILYVDKFGDVPKLILDEILGVTG